MADEKEAKLKKQADTFVGHLIAADKTDQTMLPALVHLPPLLKERVTVNTDVPAAVRRLMKMTPTARMKENIARIEAMADPVEIMIAVANGLPLPVIEIVPDPDDEGKFKTIITYVHPSANKRIDVIRALADKVMPDLGKLEISDPEGKKKGAERTFEDMLRESIEGGQKQLVLKPSVEELEQLGEEAEEEDAEEESDKD